MLVRRWDRATLAVTVMHDQIHRYPARSKPFEVLDLHASDKNDVRVQLVVDRLLPLLRHARESLEVPDSVRRIQEGEDGENVE